MSQYNYCIVTGGLVWLVLYRNTIDCIVIEAGHGLYCNTVTGPRHGAGWACRRGGTGAQALGAGQALGWVQAGARGMQVELGAHDARGTGARHRRWARGLGVLLGCGLCTWCTQPVFDPV